MITTCIAISAGVALFLSILAFSVVMLVRPGAVRITERLICPPGVKLQVDLVKLSYHRPGERGIVVSYRDEQGTHYVNGKVFLYMWLICFAASVPIAILLVLLVNYQIGLQSK